MSAFLGPIHTWLFNKIKIQDELTQLIVTQMNAGEGNEDFLQQMDKRYGTLETGELAEIIDESNIHGWLQERVSLVENRLAYAVTMLIEENISNIEKIYDIAYKFGMKHVVESSAAPKDAFEYLENILLNGMPCDRVNEISVDEADRIVWIQRTDIHKSYWDMIHGNIEYYYKIREALIKGLLSGSRLEFNLHEDGSFEIREK